MRCIYINGYNTEMVVVGRWSLLPGGFYHTLDCTMITRITLLLSMFGCDVYSVQ